MTSSDSMSRAPFQVLVLPYRLPSSGLEVAVFHRVDYNLWQFVCGGGEGNETPAQAARREAEEEAGIWGDMELLPLDSTITVPACWFRSWAEWPTDVLVIPEHCFAVRWEPAIRLSSEHSHVEWLPYEVAMKRLRFDSNKNALWELHERLIPGPRVKRPAYR